MLVFLNEVVVTNALISTPNTCHSSQGIHGPPQGIADASRRGLLWIARRSVNCAALDEQPHKYNEGYSHQQYRPPIFLKHRTHSSVRPGLSTRNTRRFSIEVKVSSHRNPLSDSQQGLFVKQKILESRERTFGVDCSTLEEYVAVSLEIVAGRAGPEADSAVRQADDVSKLAGAATGSRVRAVLTSQFAELPFVDVWNNATR